MSKSYEELKNKFQNTPSEYGEIDCWWWEAGVLDKEHMRWQLEEMKSKGVAGTWYYPRFVHGEPLEPDPAYWTDKWWDFLKWSMQEHRRLGLISWVDDWTAHEFVQHKLRQERAVNPELMGKWLTIHEEESRAAGPISIEIPENEQVLCAAAYKKVDGYLDEASRHDLNGAIHNHKLMWDAPEAGWIASVITSRPNDLDYLNRTVADSWIKFFLGTHEEKLREFLGNTWKAFGTDEWFVLRGNIAFSSSLVERFKEEKGYDPSIYLIGLFHDIGKMTDKIRCDYYDVMSSMLEENLYKPFAEWLHQHGMIFVDFCPMGKDMDLQTQTHHYGDFYRYMRNYDIPGNEWNMGPNRFHAKLASSIAHIYGRSRVGLCAYWSTGWGFNQEQNLALTNENYAYGINLYNTHGVLYTLMGGWYEWVPPEVHFYQPYWQNWKTFADHIRRLSYIFSQGKHVADVAILYPITSIHANWSRGGQFNAAADEAANAAHSLAFSIYRSGIDIDFIDDQSLCKAEIRDGKLKVSGLEFPVLLLLPMTTIRTETLRKVKEFYDAGGIVVAFSRLPNASPENGRHDPNIRFLLKEIFGISSTEEYYHPSSFQNRTLKKENTRGGKAFFVPSDAPKSVGLTKSYVNMPELISSIIVRDVVAPEEEVFHTHQKWEDLEIYFLFNAKAEKRMIEFTFRTGGEPEIWDTFTGETKPLHRFEPLNGKTKIRLNMEPYQGLVVIFTQPSGRPAILEDNLAEIDKVTPIKDGIEVHGYSSSGGKKKTRILYKGNQYASEVRVHAATPPMILDGYWAFQLQATMDNRWGDFRYPASPEFIGAEARRLRYMEEKERFGTELGWHEGEFDDAYWPEFTYSYGPYWWTIGPFQEGEEPKDLLEKAIAGEIDPAQWQWYCFSQKYGYEGKEVHNGIWGGLAGVSEYFIVFDATDKDEDLVRYLFTYVCSPEEYELTFNFGGRAPFPREAWISRQRVISIGRDVKIHRTEAQIRRLWGAPSAEERWELENDASVKVHLRKGLNPVLLKLVQLKGEKVWTYAVFHDPENPPKEERYVPLLKWFITPPKITFDIMPKKAKRAGWYRFEAPPGLRSMRLKVKARSIQAWVNGEPVDVKEGKVTLTSPSKKVSKIALRVEHQPGYYAGAAFPEPVTFDCGAGLTSLGDWCDYALESYSGGAVYTKTVKMDQEHLKGKVLLDLGKANSTAEVSVNGKPAGIRLARPYSFDVTSLLKEGENRIEVKVHNTLANHYSVGYPTNYVYEGQTVSGLLGPVTLQFLSEVTLHNRLS